MPCRPGALTGRLFQRAPNELSHAGPRTQASPRLLGKPEALPGVDRVYELFSRLLPSARVSLSSKTGTTSASRRPFQLSAQFATASALSDSQMTTPRPRARSCQRPICLMRLPLSAASCSGVILKNCEYPSWSLPWWNCQVIMNFMMIFLSGGFDFCVLSCLTARPAYYLVS